MSIVLTEILKGKRSVALSGHIRPDGDCVGSCMGLYLYLKENFPQIKTDVYLEPVADCYTIVHGTEQNRQEIQAGTQYDMFICLDCVVKSRLGLSSPLF